MNKIKKDRFYRSRGGSTQLLSIYCSQCGNHICNYQKDGTGNLHRMYLDRIVETNPDFVIPNYQPNLAEKELPNLTCKCKNRIAVPMIYEKENRLAFRLLHGAIHKSKIKIK